MAPAVMGCITDESYSHHIILSVPLGNLPDMGIYSPVLWDS